MSETPAGWYEDPLRRYDHRYWDGTSWTEHVSRAGVQDTDPLDGATPQPGATVTDTTPSVSVPRTSAELNTKAVLSLVLAVVALPAGFVLLGPLLAIGAIALGVMARREIRGSAGRQRGDGIALAGIVVGIGALLLTLLVLAAAAAFFVGGFGAMSDAVRIGEDIRVVVP